MTRWLNNFAELMLIGHMVRKYLLLAFTIAFTVQSCKKSRSDLGKTLFTETGNKVFKNVENEAFAEVFRQTLKAEQPGLSQPKLIAAFYEKNEYEPVIVLQHVKQKGLQQLLTYFDRAAEHGLNPELFKAKELKELTDKLYDKKGIQTTEDAYRDIARLEILAANSLLQYSIALQYGVVSPKRIYAAYFTDTQRPDSNSLNRIFAIRDLKVYLDSIQPANEQYLALQKALKEGKAAPGITAAETQKILKVNLERLRWKNKPQEDKYVIVNIADFRLDVMEKGKSVLNMKVCVGEGRNKDFTDNIQEYDENDLKKDRPFSRETPQLNSMIHSVQVNPVWNIPESIASKEIVKSAAEDRYYLANHNIDVFENGKVVEDPEEIDWTSGNPGKKYRFKQRPGEDNSLGKIKFLFNNQSAVYLHDTPAKAAFKQSMRAVSHGCVRLEKPLDFAHALFGDGAKYEQIKKQMEDTVAVATNISLPKKVPVYLTYFTAWDDSGTIQVRKDVYGLDIVLYTYLQKRGAI
ncbi:L,D-transpeptidase catalytic domain [Pedobacter hartonius]|uniref:L,D-transpeptidase catalytic domain n=2 Tax=Pedobacter hartonius TaxID=425514 RepID=A0A1H3WD16_9SPHI|nr:L,D-transpeptidase catalytic domain [Pedobacter hartonius]